MSWVFSYNAKTADRAKALTNAILSFSDSEFRRKIAFFRAAKLIYLCSEVGYDQAVIEYSVMADVDFVVVY